MELTDCLSSDKPEGGQARIEWEKKDTTAQTVIYHNLTDEQLAYVANCETAKEMIKNLEESFGIASHQTEAALI